MISWDVGVVTCKRVVSTLETTLQSLQDAGWDRSIISSDRGNEGPFSNWLHCLGMILSTPPDPDATSLVLIIEDDILLSRGLRSHLERNPPPRNSICSLYTAASNHVDDQDGWREIDRVPRCAHGALAYVLTRRLAAEIMMDHERLMSYATQATDRAIGYHAKFTSTPYACHVPSFVYHLGEGISCVDAGDGLGVPDGSRNCRSWIRDVKSL